MNSTHCVAIGFVLGFVACSYDSGERPLKFGEGELGAVGGAGPEGPELGGGGGEVGVTIVVPAENQAVLRGRARIRGTARAETGAIESVRVSLNAGPWALATGTTSWSFETSPLSPGAYELRVDARERGGASVQARSRFFVTASSSDQEAPVVLVTAPGDGAVVAGQYLTVIGTASDDDSVALVTVDIDEAGEVIASGTSSFSAELDLRPVSDGEHILRVRAFDSNGNSSTRALVVTVDSSLPRAVLEGGPEAASNSTTLDLRVSGPNVATYTYRLDEGDESSVQPLEQAITASGLADGSHRLEVWGISAAGTVQTPATILDWAVDTAAPTATLSGGPEVLSRSRTAEFIVEGAGVVAYRYRLDGGALSPAAAATTPLVFSALADGGHTVEVFGIDAAGNEQAAPTSFGWFVDTVAPIALLSGIPLTATPVSTLTVAVLGDGVDAYRFALDDGELSAVRNVQDSIVQDDLATGEHSLAVYGIDGAGNQQASPTLATWTVDPGATEVVVSVPAPGDQQTGDSSAPIVLGAGGTDAEEAWVVVGSAEVTFTLTGQGAGATPVELTGATYSYTVDGGSPEGPVSAAQNLTITGLSDGPHTVEITVNDGEGNSTTIVIVVVVDTQAPTARLNNPPPARVAAQALVLTVGGDGVSHYRYSFDGGSYSELRPVGLPIELYALDEGSHTLDLRGRNSLGNEQGTPTRVRWSVDLTGPAAVTLTDLPEFRTKITTASIAVSGDEVVAYRYRLNGGPYGESTLVSEILNLFDLADRTHTLEVQGIDDLGNVQTVPASHRWTVDTTAPSPVLVGAPASATSDTDFSITVTGSDLVEYSYSIDGGPIQGPFSSSTPIDLSGLSEGSHQITIFATDDLGNSDTVGTTIDFVVDTTPPDQGSVSGVPTGTANSSGVSIDVGGEPGGSYVYVLDGGEEVGPFAVGTPITESVSDGEHTLDVYLIDAAGNRSPTPTTVSWTVDSTYPEIVSGAEAPVLLTNEPMVFQFSEPVDSSSVVVSGDFFATDGYDVAVSSDGMFVTITPIGGWAVDEGAIALSFSDLAGNTSSEEFDFVRLSTATYVDGTTGNDETGSGSTGAPLQTIAAAISSAPPYSVVRVTGGSYDETIIVADGIAVVGGYYPGFSTRDPLNNTTILAPAVVLDDGVGVPEGTVNCGSGVGLALVSGFEIRAAPGDGHPAVSLSGSCGAIFSGNRIEGNGVNGRGIAVYAAGNVVEAQFIGNEIRGASSNGPSFGVLLEGNAAPLFTENLIYGGAGNPSSFGVLVRNQATARLLANTVFGGHGSSGGASRASCPATAGTSYGVRVESGAALASEADVLVGTAIETSGSLCGNSGAARSYGVNLQPGVAGATFEYTAAIGGSPSVSGCSAASESVGLFVDGATLPLDLNGVVVDGGGGCGGLGSSYGLRAVSAGPINATNSIFLAGAAALPTAIHTTSTASLGLLNVTLYDRSSSANSVGVFAADTESEIGNSIFYGFYAGFVEGDGAGDPVTLRNNGFDEVTVILRDADQSEDFVLVSSMEQDLTEEGFTATGNVSGSIVFFDVDGPDDDLFGIDDNSWALSRASSCEILQGGFDGTSAGLSTDIDGNARSATLTCDPQNAGAEGWTLGAYEL